MTACVRVADRVRDVLHSFERVAVYGGSVYRECLQLDSGAIHLKSLEELVDFSRASATFATRTALVVFDDIAPPEDCSARGLADLLSASYVQIECFDRLMKHSCSVLHIQSAWLTQQRDTLVPASVDLFLEQLWALVDGATAIELAGLDFVLRAKVTSWDIERCFDKQAGVNQWPGGEVFAEIECKWTGRVPILLSTSRGTEFRSGALTLLDGLVVRIEDDRGEVPSRVSNFNGRRLSEIGLGGNPLVARKPDQWSEKLQGSLHFGIGMSTTCDMSPPWCHSDILVCFNTTVRRGQNGSVEISLL